MEVDFADSSYDRLETDRSYTHHLPSPVVSAYRMCLQLLRAAVDDRDIDAVCIAGIKNRKTNPHAEVSIELGSGFELILELHCHLGKPSARILRVDGTSTRD